MKNSFKFSNRSPLKFKEVSKTKTKNNNAENIVCNNKDYYFIQKDAKIYVKNCSNLINKQNEEIINKEPYTLAVVTSVNNDKQEVNIKFPYNKLPETVSFSICYDKLNDANIDEDDLIIKHNLNEVDLFNNIKNRFFKNKLFNTFDKHLIIVYSNKSFNTLPLGDDMIDFYIKKLYNRIESYYLINKNASNNKKYIKNKIENKTQFSNNNNNLSINLNKFNEEHKPHFYQITSDALFNIITKRENQNIVLLGENGCNKSEYVKYISKYINRGVNVLSLLGTNINNNNNSNNKITNSNNNLKYIENREFTKKVSDKLLFGFIPIIESFSHAKTIKSNNSSRIGKVFSYIINYNNSSKSCNVVSSKVDTIMLDINRLITINKGERNFNIFYQILSSASDSMLDSFNLNNNLFKNLITNINININKNNTAINKNNALKTGDNSNNNNNTNVYYNNILKNNNNINNTSDINSVRRNPENYYYLKYSQCYYIDSINDSKQFKETIDALNLYFKEDEITVIFKIVISILLIGNIKFIEDNIFDNKIVKFTKDSIAVIDTISSLLSLGKNQLEECLTLAFKKNNYNNNNNMPEKTFLKLYECNDMKNNLAKELYSRLFDAIINRINYKCFHEEAYMYISTNKESNYSNNLNTIKEINIIDYPGFESLEFNSFEQLTINYFNERLLGLYYDYLITKEKEVYTNEDLSPFEVNQPNNYKIIDTIYNSYSINKDLNNNKNNNSFQLGNDCNFNTFKSAKNIFDLSDTIKHYKDIKDLKEDKGIFNILNEVSDYVLVNSTNINKLDCKALFNKLYKSCKDNSEYYNNNIEFDKATSQVFSISHSFKDVEYEIDSLIIKNVNKTNYNIINLMCSSSNNKIKQIFFNDELSIKEFNNNNDNNNNTHSFNSNINNNIINNIKKNDIIIDKDSVFNNNKYIKFTKLNNYFNKFITDKISLRNKDSKNIKSYNNLYIIGLKSIDSSNINTDINNKLNNSNNINNIENNSNIFNFDFNGLYINDQLTYFSVFPAMKLKIEGYSVKYKHDKFCMEFDLDNISYSNQNTSNIYSLTASSRRSSIVGNNNNSSVFKVNDESNSVTNLKLNISKQIKAAAINYKNKAIQYIEYILYITLDMFKYPNKNKRYKIINSIDNLINLLPKYLNIYKTLILNNINIYSKELEERVTSKQKNNVNNVINSNNNYNNNNNYTNAKETLMNTYIELLVRNNDYTNNNKNNNQLYLKVFNSEYLIGKTVVFMKRCFYFMIKEVFIKIYILKNLSSDCIKGLFKCYIIKKHFLILKKSAIILQEFYRNKKPRLAFLNLKKSTIKIQRKWITVLERYSFILLKTSVIKLQSFIRSYFFRLYYIKVLKASKLINSKAKAYITNIKQIIKNYIKNEIITKLLIHNSIDKIFYENMYKSTLTIQTNYRYYIARKKNKNKIYKAKLARQYYIANKMATKIQALYKRGIARILLKLKRIHAINIQSHIRMHLKRKAFIILKNCCLIIQRKFYKFYHKKYAVKKLIFEYFKDNIIYQKKSIYKFNCNIFKFKNSFNLIKYNNKDLINGRKHYKYSSIRLNGNNYYNEHILKFSEEYKLMKINILKYLNLDHNEIKTNLDVSNKHDAKIFKINIDNSSKLITFMRILDYDLINLMDEKFLNCFNEWIDYINNTNNNNNNKLKIRKLILDDFRVRAISYNKNDTYYENSNDCNYNNCYSFTWFGLEDYDNVFNNINNNNNHYSKNNLNVNDINNDNDNDISLYDQSFNYSNSFSSKKSKYNSNTSYINNSTVKKLSKKEPNFILKESSTALLMYNKYNNINKKDIINDNNMVYNYNKKVNNIVNNKEYKNRIDINNYTKNNNNKYEYYNNKNKNIVLLLDNKINDTNNHNNEYFYIEYIDNNVFKLIDRYSYNLKEPLIYRYKYEIFDFIYNKLKLSNFIDNIELLFNMSSCNINSKILVIDEQNNLYNLIIKKHLSINEYNNYSIYYFNSNTSKQNSIQDTENLSKNKSLLFKFIEIQLNSGNNLFKINFNNNRNHLKETNNYNYNTVKSISNTNKTTYILTNTGFLFCLNSNKYYLRSSSNNNNNNNSNNSNSTINNNNICPSPFFVKTKILITQISCGFKHTIAISSINLCYGWGDNNYSQLGFIYPKNIDEPQELDFSYCYSNRIKVLQVAAGYRCSYFLSDQCNINNVLFCGYNNKELNYDYRDNIINKSKHIVILNTEINNPELFIDSEYKRFNVLKIECVWNKQISLLYSIIGDTFEYIVNKSIANKKDTLNMIKYITSKWVYQYPYNMPYIK